MLWHYPECQSLKREFTSCLYSYAFNLTSTEQFFIFNIDSKYPVADLQILMIIKHYIYFEKCLNKPLSLVALQIKIKYFCMLPENKCS